MNRRRLSSISNHPGLTPEASTPKLLTSSLVLAGVSWLLVGPRVSLIELAGSSVRLEDFVLVALWVFVAVNWKSIRPILPARRVLPITLVSLFAMLVAVLSHQIDMGPGLLYSLRTLEYWAVFPALLFVLRDSTNRIGIGFTRTLAVITLVHVSISAAQSVFGLSIGFSKFALDRGAGLTAGPYELGALCAMLAIFWLSRRRYALAAVSCVGIVQSSSRISIIAVIVGIAVLVVLMTNFRGLGGFRDLRIRPGVALSVLATLAVLGVFFSVSSSSELAQPVAQRLEETSAPTSWSVSGEVASASALPKNSAEYSWLAYDGVRSLLNESYFLDASTGATSDMVRFYRWHLLINSLNTPNLVLFGLGPSFPGPSVDGSYLRMLAETGAAGAVVWLYCIFRWGVSSSPAAKAVLATMLVGGVFIDVFYSMKLMVLLWGLLAFDDSHRLRSEPSTADESTVDSQSAETE